MHLCHLALLGYACIASRTLFSEVFFMGYLSTLIRAAFQWALYFALVGGLGEATATLYKEAGHARAYGLVSLVRLNSSLVGRDGLPHSRTHSQGSTGRKP